jgi:hypothetical protein
MNGKVCKICGWEDCVCIPKKPKWLDKQDYEFIQQVCGDYTGDIIETIDCYRKK